MNDDDVVSLPAAYELDIRDAPILERGVPTVDEDPDPWLGAVLRATAYMIGQCLSSPSWEQIRDGLDAATLCIQDELLPEALGIRRVMNEVHPSEAERYLRIACPPTSNPRERGRWARAVGHTIFGMIMATDPMPEDPAAFQTWMADKTRGLSLFCDFVRAENGPLTWATS